MKQLITMALATLLSLSAIPCFAASQAAPKTRSSFATESISCSICLEPFTQDAKIIAHCTSGRFHQHCIQSWHLRKSGQADGEPTACPYCSLAFSKEQQLALATALEPFTEYPITLSPQELKLVKFADLLSTLTVPRITLVTAVAISIFGLWIQMGGTQ